MPEREDTYQVIVSKRAAHQLANQAAFVARLDERLAHSLVKEFNEAAQSLQRFPYRYPAIRSAECVTDKYRKMVFNKRYILIYQIKGETVYIEFVIDGRQDYQWLLNSPE